jgi:DNA-binding XRE family transcriptional regulator
MHARRQGGHVTDSDERFSGVAGSDERPLRQWRAERLLSIRELAQRAGVAPSTIYLIEAGRSTPQFAVARHIAAALEVDPHAVAEFRRAIRVRGASR